MRTRLHAVKGPSQFPFHTSENTQSIHTEMLSAGKNERQKAEGDTGMGPSSSGVKWEEGTPEDLGAV